MKDSSTLSEFKKNGFLHIKGFYKLGLIEKIKASLLEEINIRGKDIPASDKKLSDDKIEFITDAQRNLSSDFNELFNLSPLHDLVEFLLGEKSELFTSEVLVKSPFTGFGYRPHQDAAYFCSKENRGLNSWTPLEESNESNGGIWYFPGSHLLGELPHQVVNVNDYCCDINALREKGLKKLLPDAKPGDLLIHDCLLVHGSSPNKSSKRRMAVSRFYLPNSNSPDRGKYVMSLKNSIIAKGDFKKV